MTIDLSPEEFRRLGYAMIDAIATQLAAINDAPVRRPVPADLRETLMHSPIPQTGNDPAAILQYIAETVFAYPMGNASPRFFAWVNSPPAPLAILADLMASAQDPSVAGGDHSATYIEHGVLNWLKQIVHYPESAGGLLTSGGSMANLIGLTVMRHVKTSGTIRTRGFADQSAPMVIYTSVQGHSCIEKAIQLLGFGSDYLRKIPVDADYRMDLVALRAQIAADRSAGLNPVCIVVSVGTVNTGAIDPIDAIADVCEAENLWLHLDGAYGAVGILADQARELYTGIERADSLALDPHKWLYVPIECGCALVKDSQAMRDTFSLVPPYLHDDKALPWFSEFGIQQTRGFKALKLWAMIEQLGVEGYRALITRDVTLAKYLQAKIADRSDFALVAAGPLSITCFRYAPENLQEAEVDRLNRRIAETVQAEGQAFLTTTELNGRTVLRACIVNFRTTETDLDCLLNVIADAGQRLLAV